MLTNHPTATHCKVMSETTGAPTGSYTSESEESSPSKKSARCMNVHAINASPASHASPFKSCKSIQSHTSSCKPCKLLQVKQAHAAGLRISIFGLLTKNENLDGIEKSPDFMQTDKVKYLVNVLKK